MKFRKGDIVWCPSPDRKMEDARHYEILALRPDGSPSKLKRVKGVHEFDGIGDIFIGFRHRKLEIVKRARESNHPLTNVFL